MDIGFDHNKLLKNIAKKRLSPYDIYQHGKSRIFLYDNGWWIIIIEFQPSSFSKGTYLNIGINFNFYPNDSFAFSYGHREKNLEEAENEVLFEKIINDYCDYTIKKVEKLKYKFRNVHAAIKTFKKQEFDSWDHFDLAMLYGITGQLNRSRRRLKKVIREKCEHDFEIERRKVAKEILPWLGNHQMFLENIKALIIKTRQLKKLPVKDITGLEVSNAGTNSLIKIWRQLVGK